ncbi:MAG: DinB family protein [Bacteroidetes bacterium]|nr:DinB family protein [Bacteroidota bacterium]MCW5894750.1 DinB family protein [Bacteroidota bacterium]
MAADATRYPEPTEYAPYYRTYVSLVPKEDILATLNRQKDETLRLLRGIPQSQEQFRYAPGKWSIRELLGHVIDSERVFSYRALRISRNDKTPLPGFEQEPYIQFGNYDACPLAELSEEFSHVRQATTALFKHLSDEAWLRSGTASNAEVSVRALAYIIAGHEVHHRNILQTKYL